MNLWRSSLLISLQASGLTFLKNEIPHTYFWRLLRYNPWEEVLIQHPRAVLQQLLCSCNWKPWKIAAIREKISIHFNNVTGCKYFSSHVFFNAFHQKCWTACCRTGSYRKPIIYCRNTSQLLLRTLSMITKRSEKMQIFSKM